MNQQSLDDIERHAKEIMSPGLEPYAHLLRGAYQTARRVYATFLDGQGHTYEEVAEKLALSDQTVRQILVALRKGGMNLVETQHSLKLAGRFPAHSGRPKIVIQKGKKGKKAAR